MSLASARGVSVSRVDRDSMMIGCTTIAMMLILMLMMMIWKQSASEQSANLLHQSSREGLYVFAF